MVVSKKSSLIVKHNFFRTLLVIFLLKTSAYFDAATNYFLTFRIQIKDGFAEGKDLVVSVMSAMGEEQINALKDIGPK